MEILFITFICLIIFVWYICALLYIACELWKYDCGAYTSIGYWICKIATFGTKK